MDNAFGVIQNESDRILLGVQSHFLWIECDLLANLAATCNDLINN